MGSTITVSGVEVPVSWNPETGSEAVLPPEAVTSRGTRREFSISELKARLLQHDQQETINYVDLSPYGMEAIPSESVRLPDYDYRGFRAWRCPGGDPVFAEPVVVPVPVHDGFDRFGSVRWALCHAGVPLAAAEYVSSRLPLEHLVETFLAHLRLGADAAQVALHFQYPDALRVAQRTWMADEWEKVASRSLVRAQHVPYTRVARILRNDIGLHAGQARVYAFDVKTEDDKIVTPAVMVRQPYGSRYSSDIESFLTSDGLSLLPAASGNSGTQLFAKDVSLFETEEAQMWLSIQSVEATRWHSGFRQG